MSNYNHRYNKNWLYENYRNLYSGVTGGELLKEEKDFLKIYFDPFNENGGKKVYYMAIFRLKRGWYVFFVYFLIARTLKKDFQKVENLASLHRVFAKKMLNDAIKGYCKISD